MEKYVNYNALLDTLFEQWKNSYDEDNRNRLCKDGLMLKPDESLNVDQLWEEAPRRVMFLLKDCPDGWGWDTRELLSKFDKEGKIANLTEPFYQKIAKLFYGLLENKFDYRVNDRIVNANLNKVKETWKTIPLAFLEAKKLAGGPTCEGNVLKEALNRDKVFLKKEIDILAPNIIVCCDGEGIMFDFITNEYFGTPDWKYDKRYPFWDDKKQEEYFKPGVTMQCRLRYYKQRNLIVINSYHPSYVVADWEFQERVYCPFSAFLKQCDHNF